MKRLPVLWMFLAILGSWNVIRGTGTPDMTSNQTRFKRNADPLSDYSGKLSTVARISNGISLLAGLINKNIPIDTVIEELLHFGNVNLSDVVALQKDKMLGAIDNLESVQKTLEGVPDLEEKILGLFRIQDLYTRVGDFSSFTIPTQYFDRILIFAEDRSDFSVYSKMNQVLGKFLQEMENLQFLWRFSPRVTIDAFNEIQKLFVEFAQKLDDSSTGPSAQLRYVCMILKQDVFSELKPIITLLDVHKTSASQGSAGSPGDLAKIESLKTELKELDPVLKLVSSKSHSRTVLNSLQKDIRDKSVENTIGSAGHDFSKLSGGLKPLIDLIDKIDPIVKKFETLTDSKIQKSMNIPGNLHKLVSTMDDAKSSLDSLERSQFSSFSADDITKLLEDSKKLSGDMVVVREYANEISDTPTVLQTWIQPLVGGSPQDSIEAKEKLTELRGKEWKIMKAWFVKIQKALNKFPNVTETQNVARRIRDTKDKFDAFRTKVIDDVIPKLQILKDASMDPVIQSLQVARVIRSLTPEDIGTLKLAVETITNQTGVISGIQKTSLNQTEETRDLVKWKDLQKSSESLKSAALCIQNMEEFAKMGPLIQKIKASTVFEVEIQKVKDPVLKREVLSKYGDQKTFVALLESVQQQINAFKAKLPAEKNLRNLGNSLKSAKLVDDVVVGEKLKAIQTLMLESMKDSGNLKDPQVLKDLDELKGHLETLASLDLQFSRHHSTFPGVTDALNSFFDFLGGFLTPRKPPPGPPPKPSGSAKPSGSSKPSGVPSKAPGASGAPATRGIPTESSSSVGMYIGIGIGSLVAICALIVLGFWLYRRRNKDKKKPWEWIKRWFATTCFHTIPEALGYGKGILNEMKKESAELKTKKTDAKKMRNPTLPMPLDTALILPDGRFINANYLTTWDGLKLIVAQGPMDSTAVDFLFMVINQECEYVVMVCKASEVVKYVPDHPKELLKIGDYEVSMESMEDADKAVVIRKLVAFDTKEKKSHKFTHIHHCEWPDLGIPKSSDDVVGILETINKSKKPVVVHCATGVGRSVVLAGAEIIARDVERHPRKASTEPFIQLARLRLKGFQNTQQAQYTVLIAHRLLLNQYAKGSPEDEKMFAARLDMFEKVLGVLKMEEDGWEKEVNRVKTVVDGLPEVATATARPESSKELVFMLPSPERQERSNTVFDEIPTNPPQAPRAVGGVEPVVIDME